MKEIIEWMMNVEKLASEIYDKAALYFVNDFKMNKFLERLAADEAWHYHIISSALEHLNGSTKNVPLISLKQNTIDEIQGIVLDISNQIESKTLTKAYMLKQIVHLEFSEWNDVFRYIVNFLKKELKEYKVAAPRIQSHRRFIEHFLEDEKDGHKLLKELKKIPEIWTEHILIVEDDVMISELIQTILNHEGKIDIANNGKEALNRLKDHFYKLIISDVNMPVMDGVIFFKNACEIYPDIKNRFLFFTGDLSHGLKTFLSENKLKYLTKPSSIKEIRKAALDVLLTQ